MSFLNGLFFICVLSCCRLAAPQFQARQQYPTSTVSFSPDPARPCSFLRESIEAPSAPLERFPELHRCHTGHAPKDLRERTRARVTDLQRDFDQATGGFANEL